MTDSTTYQNKTEHFFGVDYIKYFGTNDAGQTKMQVYKYSDALQKGTEFKEDGYTYNLAPLSELAYYMHKHAPRLNVKIHSTYLKTIKELYLYDWYILYDLLLLKGGKIFLGQILTGVDEFYEQEQLLEQCERNQM